MGPDPDRRARVVLIDDLRSFVDGRAAAKMAQALRHWGYHVRVAAGSPHVAYTRARSS